MNNIRVWEGMGQGTMQATRVRTRSYRRRSCSSTFCEIHCVTSAHKNRIILADG